MTDHSQAITELVLQIFRLNGQLLTWGDHFVSSDWLTGSSWQMLGAISKADSPQTTPQMAARMGVSRQGAQKQINQLLESGLLIAHKNTAHARSPLYSLSPKGAAIFERINACWLAQATEWGAELKAQELLTAAKVLEHLIAKIAVQET